MIDKKKTSTHYHLDEMLHYESDRQAQKILALKFFLYISMFIMFPFSLINFLIFDLFFLGAFELSVGLLSILLLYMIRKANNYTLVAYIFVSITGVVILSILLLLQTEESTLVWAPIFPIIAFFLLGSRNGTIAHILFSTLLFSALLMGLHNGHYTSTSKLLANVGGALVSFGVFVYFYEATKNKALQLVFRHSVFDELTGAGNRKMFTLLLQKEKAASQRHIRPFSLIMVDLDHFKSVNDRFGHISGDQVLTDFTHLLKNNLRRGDLLFRWGGEEFIILLPDESVDQARLLSEKLRTVIENHPFEPVGKLTASFGVTEVQPGESDEESIRRLDQALYQAKENGRNRVEVV